VGRTPSKNTIEYKIGQIFGEIKNKISSGYNLREIIDHIDELRVPEVPVSGTASGCLTINGVKRAVRGKVFNTGNRLPLGVFLFGAWYDNHAQSHLCTHARQRSIGTVLHRRIGVKKVAGFSIPRPIN
jgi:hypothetical protein